VTLHYWWWKLQAVLRWCHCLTLVSKCGQSHISKRCTISSLQWIVILFFRTLTQILYYTIILSVAGMSGNPFLNFLLQSLIELPGFLIGRAVCDRLGRRWSQAGAFMLAAVFQLACLFTVMREWQNVSLYSSIKLKIQSNVYKIGFGSHFV